MRSGRRLAAVESLHYEWVLQLRWRLRGCVPNRGRERSQAGVKVFVAEMCGSAAVKDRTAAFGSTARGSNLSVMSGLGVTFQNININM